MVESTRGRMMTALAITGVLIMVSISSGCINVYWGKGVINPDEGKFVYKERKKIEAKHYFDTVVNDADSMTNQTTNVTTIVDGTDWIKVYIDIRLDELFIPIPFPLPVPIEDNRYVHIVITMPDGVTWFEKTYNTTQNETLQILSPAEGDWVFTVDAMGLGSDLVSYHDSYSLLVKAREPVKKE